MDNKKVEIIPSAELTEMRMDSVIGRKGVITEIPEHGKGAYVELEKPYLREAEWYFPNSSLRYCEW